LGIERIAKYATDFGLGQKTGIDLPNEVSGVMPSEEWKIRNFKQKWFAGETISVGIGQGAIAITPVQLLRAISAISMGGKMVVPHVINPTEMPPGLIEAGHYADVKNVSVDPAAWNFITDAMSRVLLPEGTAPSAHIPGIDIAGKTGSAQIVSLATRAKFKNSDALAQNGWFVGFTPRRNPDIVVCVLFQGGEHGKLAARLATQVIKAYVEKRDRSPQKMTEKPKSNGTVDVGGLWSDPDTGAEKDALQAARFVVDLPKKRMVMATAAPGIN
jgi:penicillin-binding protein 2